MLDGLWTVLLALSQYASKLGICGQFMEHLAHWLDAAGGDDLPICLCICVDEWGYKGSQASEDIMIAHGTES